MNKMVIIGCMSLLLWAQSVMAEETTVSVYAMNLAPYFWLDEHGQWQGMYAELASVLIKQAGMQPKFEALPWIRGLDYLQSGKLEMTSLLSKTPEREKFIHFIGVSGIEQTTLLVKQGEVAKFQAVQTLDDLAQKGYTWGIRDKTFYSKEFNHRLETDAAFRSHFDIIVQIKLNALKAARGNRFSGAFVDRIGMSYALKTDDTYNGLAMVIVPFFPPADVYFGVSKRIAPEKLEKLQAAYDTLKAQGAFKAIIARWID
ncbi:MAG: amino acid ABC transporter substrate-binding protein [Deltaproteobacteria bacterium]|nr:amino acid ABC transporter substrate-binding protein [Deltaproteobacteria bacterium]